VVALRTATGFIVPMPFGEATDWFRNIAAADGCGVRWHGKEYVLVEPEVIDWATARPAFSPVLRLLVPIIGIHQFVRLRHAPSSREAIVSTDTVSSVSGRAS
jgi:hypothetical protein